MSFGGRAGSMADTMALLWGTKPPGTRGRKPGMTVDEIVAAAIADADGLDALSMRRVAPLLAPHLDPTRFPALASGWQDEELAWEDEFEFGLARVLAGIEAYVGGGDA